MYFTQNGFDMSLQLFVRFIASHLSNHWFKEAKAVAQLLGTGSKGSVDITGSEPMNVQCVYKTQCYLFVLLPRKSVFYSGFKYLTAIYNLPDFRNRPEGCVLF